MTRSGGATPDTPGGREYTTVVAIAGIPLVVRSNSAQVIAAFEARHDAGDTPDGATLHCTMTVRVAPGGTLGDVRAQAKWEFPDDNRATVTGPGVSVAGELNPGVAIANVTEAFVRGHPLFRATVVDGMSLWMLGRKDRHPVHAAAVRQGGAAVLLCGRSGVGKSTLAYVADRAGLEVLSDDWTRVQLAPALRVWGEGRRPIVHLLKRARDEHAELRDVEPDWVSAGGELKLSIRAREHSAAGPFADAVRVCLLTRDGSGISRRPATSAEISDALVNAPEAVADRDPGQRRRVAAALAQAGGWHLNLSADPADAIPHLRAMLASIRRF